MKHGENMISEFMYIRIWGAPKMVVANNHGFFLLKMIILGCLGGTTIHLDFSEKAGEIHEAFFFCVLEKPRLSQQVAPVKSPLVNRDY